MSASEQERRPATRLVVVAASAGGLDPLCRLLEMLPSDFPAAVAIVQHRAEQNPELLCRLLERRTALRVRDAIDGDFLEAGVVYICPPGVHMTAGRALHLAREPRIQHVRPSADRMFASVAETIGARAVAVVLSGMGTTARAGRSRYRRTTKRHLDARERRCHPRMPGGRWPRIRAASCERAEDKKNL